MPSTLYTHTLCIFKDVRFRFQLHFNSTSFFAGIFNVSIHIHRIVSNFVVAVVVRFYLAFMLLCCRYVIIVLLYYYICYFCWITEKFVT